MPLIDELRKALQHPNVQAFLRVIRAGESSQDDSAYATMFGGGRFTDLTHHPNQAITRGNLTSTAAGAYQFLHRTWVECAAAVGLIDFGPLAQDLGAVFLIRRRNALADVLAGRISAAITKCNREWASLPGSPYGQPTRTLAQALATYAAHGGVLDGMPAPAPPPAPSPAPPSPAPALVTSPETKTMPLPAIIGALLPSLIEAIPKLGKLFGSGSEVAERNVAAATMAVQIAQEAVGARNAQEAVEVIKADPTAAQVAQTAIQDRWLELTEAGGDGIAGARKADAAIMLNPEVTLFKSPAFVVTLLLLPLVYMTVGAVLFTDKFSDDMKAMVIGAVISGLLVGALTSYWFGTSASSARKTELGAAPSRL